MQNLSLEKVDLFIGVVLFKITDISVLNHKYGFSFKTKSTIEI